MSRTLTSTGWLAAAADSRSDDTRDPPALDDEPRLAGLDRDAVVEAVRAAFLRRFADVNHFADDAAGRDDLVAAS